MQTALLLLLSIFSIVALGWWLSISRPAMPPPRAAWQHAFLFANVLSLATLTVLIGWATQP